jgi:hypothetical protein
MQHHPFLLLHALYDYYGLLMLQMQYDHFLHALYDHYDFLHVPKKYGRML